MVDGKNPAPDTKKNETARRFTVSRRLRFCVLDSP
jgi:hypothetical protein